MNDVAPWVLSQHQHLIVGCHPFESSPAGGNNFKQTKANRKPQQEVTAIGVVCIITLATYCCWSKNDLELTSTVL
ncbi:hypothetical protein AALO_G00014630 [Alosa alosa]|uniref:Uncharacterized protein n=1 Tax=Alosa alosa TaxID=278164 RepID=A0AAV6HGF4_9TELE|nr:hypothetical protein AALO_G00014630 [Alosa alosa]